MLFSTGVVVAAGTTIVLACLDKTLDSYGLHSLGNVLKIALPLIGLAAGVYFIETNPLIWWLK